MIATEKQVIAKDRERGGTWPLHAPLNLPLDVVSEACGYTIGKPRHFETWCWNKDVDLAICRKRVI